MSTRRWALRLALLSLGLLPFTAGAQVPPKCRTIHERQEGCLVLSGDLTYDGGAQRCVQGPGTCALAD
jgi:hypothetical protein